MKLSYIKLIGPVVGLLCPLAAHTADVGFSIIEHYGGPTETVSAVWSSDPAAHFTVTLATNSPEVWLIDLTGSGHATIGGSDFVLLSNNGVVSWVEPEHPGLYNNLYFVDNLHWRLESEQPVAANPNASRPAHRELFTAQ